MKPSNQNTEQTTRDYSIVQPVVDAICQSLQEEPETWELDTYDISRPDKFNNKLFCIKYSMTYFTKVRTGSTTERVFSIEQGKQIYESYVIALNTRGSELQKDLVQSIEHKPKQSLIGRILTFISAIPAPNQPKG